MILKLELNTLIENGCSIKVATELMETKTTLSLQCNEGNFYVSKEKNMVYTGIDFYRKLYFEDGDLRFPYNCTELIPDYFDFALIEFMQKQKTVVGVLFNEAKQFEKFKIKEIERTKERITSQKEFLNKMKHYKFKSKENDIEICESYIDFLNLKEYKPQQLEAVIPDEVKKEPHNNIFVDNSFEIWQKMFEEFNIDASKRTDLDFMFEIMKYNGLIYENIGLMNMQNWINITYQITIEKLKYTNVNTKANQKRMTVYNLINSKQ